MTAPIVKRLADAPVVQCPCGEARRILTAADNALVSIHRVHVHKDARMHYHKKLTEYYVILSGSGEIALDGDRVRVQPGDVVMIPPGTRHAARGEFEIVNVVCPPFDGVDEYDAQDGSPCAR